MSTEKPEPFDCLPTQDWIHNIHPDLQNNPDTLVALSGAARWIALVRAPQAGALDVAETARNMGVMLVYEDTRGRIRGETRGIPFSDSEPLTIALDSFESAEANRVTMGHEMGHVFLEVLGYRHVVHSPLVEEFCEAMAREVTLPLEYLVDVHGVNTTVVKQLMAGYGLEAEDVIRQLMRAGKLPPKVAIDSRIDTENSQFADKVCRSYICLNCTHDRSCPPADFELPVLDFTDSHSWGSFGNCLSEEDYFWDQVKLDALTKHYDNQLGTEALLSSPNSV